MLDAADSIKNSLISEIYAIMQYAPEVSLLMPYAKGKLPLLECWAEIHQVGSATPTWSSELPDHQLSHCQIWKQSQGRVNFIAPTDILKNKTKMHSFHLDVNV